MITFWNISSIWNELWIEFDMIDWLTATSGLIDWVNFLFVGPYSSFEMNALNWKALKHLCSVTLGFTICGQIMCRMVMTQYMLQYLVVVLPVCLVLALIFLRFLFNSSCRTYAQLTDHNTKRKQKQTSFFFLLLLCSKSILTIAMIVM